ncbi:MAG: 7-cyano-7-deazaguanine synthase [Pirellulales bacterium]|nr:7-cyano-7-deazaguanine synthase [Pirellulales bacterium]
MNALNARFRFTVSDGERVLSLQESEHFRIYPTERFGRFGEDLTARQVDMIRIATAVHVADSWCRRRQEYSGLRIPVLQVEVLDPAFWLQPATMDYLKPCVDFVSGGDDWQFSFLDAKIHHERVATLFPKYCHDTLVAPYSGGLDSACGLALRAAAQPGRMFVPVTIRHQMQKSSLVRRHFALLLDRLLLERADLNAFQAGAFIRKKHIERDLGEVFRETTHRCRPLLFMAVAGIVAHSFSAPVVEVFESGVGSINLPLVGGPADYHTTRSTHPAFLRLLSALLSHVNDSAVSYVLPFADKTKAEMVKQLKGLGLEELARSSFSCIAHPLRRNGWQQCGYCPACVFRRRAMHSAGIVEQEAYAIDLFAGADSHTAISERQMFCVRAFHQQVEHLRELDHGVAPESFYRYLRATEVPLTEDAMALEVHRRYREEWLLLIAEGRHRGFPWLVPTTSLAVA